MNYQVNKGQVEFYQKNGFLVIEDFLSADELEHWRAAVMNAVQQRNGQKMPGKDLKTGEADGINEDAAYYGKVFDQLLNLWQTDGKVKKLMFDDRLGKMAAQLAPDHSLV